MGMPEFTRKRRFSGGHSPRLHRTFWPPTGYRLFQKGHRHLPFTAKPLHFAHSPHRAFFGRNPTSFIVGYATRPINQGFSVNTPTFVDVTSDDDTIDLQSLVVVDGVGSQGESIQVLGANGVMTGVTYYWLTADDIGEAGWYDDNWEKYENVKLNKGDGLIFATVAGANLQSSGKVVIGETEVTLNAGFTVAGNNTNRDLDLQDLKIKDGVGSQGESIQVLGSNGVMTGVTYYWLTEADIGEDGWYDDNWEKIEGVTVKAGEAFVFAAVNGAKLVLPSQL